MRLDFFFQSRHPPPSPRYVKNTRYCCQIFSWSSFNAAGGLLAGFLIHFHLILPSILEGHPALDDVTTPHFLQFVVFMVFHDISNVLKVLLDLSPDWYLLTLSSYTGFVSCLWTLASAVRWNQEGVMEIIEKQLILIPGESEDRCVILLNMSWNVIGWFWAQSHASL